MAGIIGYFTQEKHSVNDRLLVNMAQALEPAGRFHKDLWQSDGVGLGRVSLRIVNAAQQPVWNKSGDVGVVMEGELYGKQELVAELSRQGYSFNNGDDAELILNAYLAYGDEFIHRLNGAFVLAILDQRTGELIIATDRIGQYPLYYYQTQNGLIFASGVRALFVYEGLSCEVDRAAIAQFLKFNHVLGERTLLKEVKRLEPASLLIWRENQMHRRQYWKMDHPQAYELRSEHDWMDELLFYLRQAVSRQSSKGESLGLLLSGGLDSRCHHGIAQ